MERFVQLRREGGRREAWQQWMEEASLSAATLCPAIIPYDNLMKLIMEVDTTLLKGSSEHVGATPEENLREFLTKGTLGGKPL